MSMWGHILSFDSIGASRPVFISGSGSTPMLRS